MIAAPAKTARPILDKIHGEAKSVVAMQDVKDQIITDGMLPMDNPSIAELQDFVNSEIIRWSKVVQQAGIAGRSDSFSSFHQSDHTRRTRVLGILWAFGPSCYSISPKGAKVLKSKILPFPPQVIPLPEAKGVPPYSPAWRTVGLDNCINPVHREISSFVCV